MVIILTDNKSFRRFFQTKIFPQTLWNACDYVILNQLRYRAYSGQKQNSSWFFTSPRNFSRRELIIKIREVIPTTPIELHVQSAGVSEEEQIFYTVDDDETEEQIWQRKKKLGFTQ